MRMYDLVKSAKTSDPTAHAGPACCNITTSKGHLRTYTAGPRDAETVLFLHGFPEIAYSWRHQFEMLFAQGYRVVAPDLLGCGASAAPNDDVHYTIQADAGTVIDVISALEIGRLTLVAHDWGARIAWKAAELIPERISGLFIVNAAWQPRPPKPPLELLPRDHFSFLRSFAAPKAASLFDQDIDRAVRFFLVHLYGSISEQEVRFLHAGRPVDANIFPDSEPSEKPAWLNETDLEVYTDAFRRTGFGPSLARYRNTETDWKSASTQPPGQPVSLLLGTRDPTVLFNLYQPMLSMAPALDLVALVKGAGHAMPSERPDLVNSELLAFLQRHH